MAQAAPDHVYTVYISASPERIWRALTDGVETERYYYGTRVGSDWSKGSRIVYEYPDGRVAADGEVLEIDPPRRLDMTFHARWDPEMDAQGPVRQVWEIAAGDDGTSKLTVTTIGLTAGSRMADEFGGGMIYIVSGLKTWVETGEPLVAGAA